MRILVTGGAGFIGSHVVDAYIQAGHDVLVLDNLVTGKRQHINRDARFEELAIQDPLVENVFLDFKPDIVNHHAAHINLRQSVIDPMFDAENNILGSLNLLKASVRSGVRKIIFASTGGAIYGDPDTNPVSESCEPLPLSPYGASKLAIEHYIRIWRHIHGLDYTVFRYPNVYGPRQDPKGEAGVVAIFSIQIRQGIHPRIFGDGSKTRDYLFIDDLVKANLLALDGGSCQTLNLGWGRDF
ncbi:MAG TPA: NAD-dependent epimerase/dehydratase family protein [bacterium]|nr:NAD-dependent epimerase/dehydratase family protein [bacterium]